MHSAPLRSVAGLNGTGSEVLRQAFGIAEYHGPRSQMMREIDNPTMLHDGSGVGAMTGVSAALLAQRGFAGAPALTVEDPAVAEHWQDLGRFWTIEKNYIKPYPVCRWAHARHRRRTFADGPNPLCAGRYRDGRGANVP